MLTEMYKSLRDKLETYHKVCNEPSGFKTAFASFYKNDFYAIRKELISVLQSPYLLFFLDNEHFDSICENDGAIPDLFSFRMCGKLKNERSTPYYYKTRYLFFKAEVEKGRLEVYAVNNSRDSVDTFFETDDKLLIATIEAREYTIDKIRSILVSYLSEELEYLTKTFAMEVKWNCS